MLLYWSWIGGEFASEAKVEEEAGCAISGRRDMLDEEGKGRYCADGRGVTGLDEKALGNGEMAGREGMDSQYRLLCLMNGAHISKRP